MTEAETPSSPASAPLLLWITDGAAGTAATAQALDLARALDAELHGAYLLPVWTAPIADVPLADAVSQQAFDASARAQGEALLADAAAQARAAGVRWRPHLLPGQYPVSTVGELARTLACRCIVVGTDSHNAVWRLLGGDPVPGLISHAPVPVLVCKP